MTTLIGFCLVAGVALFVAFMRRTLTKFIAWKMSREPEIETEHDWDAAEFLENRE
jgi:hypothetical protein